ncbi:MAG: amino acid ABC transporter substrate-binding protein, partial [Candidatus Rokubacteria bacterium]|nr:amino acid ABC transporter substrate-binding protein [Candidatus Rokubacteria bacterium]
MRAKWLMLPALALVALALSLGHAREASTQAKAPDAILVGATLAVTGPFSAEVGVFRKMMENWAEMVNAKGGIALREYGKKLPLKFIIYDDTSKPPDSQRLYEKLITEDKVHLLLGPYSSPITIAASTVAEKHKIPFMALEANATPIFTRGFEWMVGVIDDGPKWSFHYFDMLKAEGKARTIAFVIEDTPHPKEVGSGSIPKAKEIGLKSVLEEYFPVATQDFTPVIAKIKAADPDIVYVAAFPARSLTFFKQAIEQGVNPREFHVIHHGAAFREPAGKAANLVTGENYWMPGVKGGPNVAEFEELLQKTGIKVEDFPWASIHFFGFEALRAGLEKAGTLDREKVLTALRGLDIQTISGRLRFHKPGENMNPKTAWQGTLNPFPTQIQDGKYVAVWPSQFATGKHIYPR